jgi:hypothetical protein
MNGSRSKKIGRAVTLFLQKNALTETGIVSIFFLLFSASMIFLDTKIDQDLDPDIGKEWWTLSFETRDPSSLEFAIENHSGSTDFSYEVTRDKIILDEGAVSVKRSERKIIIPSGNGDTAGRTTVIIESGDGSKKSIYRER